jgi:hypothetical protein
VRNEMMAFGACKWNGETPFIGHKPLHSRGKAGIQVLSGGRAEPPSVPALAQSLLHRSRRKWGVPAKECDKRAYQWLRIINQMEVPHR